MTATGIFTGYFYRLILLPLTMTTFILQLLH